MITAHDHGSHQLSGLPREVQIRVLAEGDVMCVELPRVVKEDAALPLG